MGRRRCGARRTRALPGAAAAGRERLRTRARGAGNGRARANRRDTSGRQAPTRRRGRWVGSGGGGRVDHRSGTCGNGQWHRPAQHTRSPRAALRRARLARAAATTRRRHARGGDAAVRRRPARERGATSMNGSTRGRDEALAAEVGRSWKVLIADDEPLARARLRALLVRHPEFELTAECGSGAAVLAALRNGPADVLLLDIRMPGLDGIATVEALAREAPWSLERPPCVVFVTASEEHAIRAFDLDAVDYLVKPVDIDRFDRAMRRLLETLGSRSRPITSGAMDAGALAAADAALRAALQALRGDAPAPASDAAPARNGTGSEGGYAK